MKAKDVEAGFYWGSDKVMVMHVEHYNSHPLCVECDTSKAQLVCDYKGQLDYIGVKPIHRKYVGIAIRYGTGGTLSMTLRPDEEVDCYLSSNPYR